MTQSVLIVGAEGMIGRALAARFGAEARVLRTTQFPEKNPEPSLALDLETDISGWRPPEKIDLAFICAAVTSVERCRTAPEATRRVNVENTLAIARSLAASGAFVVFLSSSLVFDGTSAFQKASDPTSPQTAYGRQKAEVEKELLGWGERAGIVRLTKVWGPRVALLEQWATALKNGTPVRPFSDLWLSPVPLPFAVEVLYQAGTRRLAGISQLSGARDVTYAHVCHRVAERLRVDPGLVQPVSAASAGLARELVVEHTTLDMSRLTSLCGLQPPELESVLDGVDLPVG